MPVAVGLIGCGQRGLKLLEIIQGCPEIRIAAVCDIDASRAEAAGRLLGVRAERDPRRLWEGAEVGAVLVATGARWHAPVVLDALAAGRHVYVEKPLADSPGASRRMAEAAEAAGVVAMVGYQRRFTPFAAALAAELPAIEAVQAVLVGQRLPLNPQYFFPDHYGGIVDHMTHTLDLALWTMGGRPEGVLGHVRRGTILGDRTIEFMELIVDFDEGTRSATVVASMLGVGAANLTEFVGTRGTLWSSDNRTLHVTGHPRITQPGNRPPEGIERREVRVAGAGSDEGTVAALRHFADRVAGLEPGGWPRGCTFAEGADRIAVSAAMVRSAEEGRRVRLTEVE